MLRPIACRGAPRDMGFDQGSACRVELWGRYAGTPRAERLRWRAGWRDADSARVARHVARHFPRQAEAIQGLARGSGVPRAWLEALLAGSAIGASGLGAPAAAAAVAQAAAGRAQRGGAERSSAAKGDAWVARARPESHVVRRARPDGGFACLELAPPWYTGALAAVSEVGLAGAAIALPAGRELGGSAPPAMLLLQDALHRTESLPSALEWCLRRPAGGRTTLLFADAGGELAGVVVAGDERRVLRPEGGLLVGAGGDGEALAKSLRAAGAPDAASLARSLCGPGVVLDPGRRRLGLSEPSGHIDWLALG